MTIERITRTPIMHRVVASGDVLYLGGITAGDCTGLDMRAQTEAVLGKAAEILASAGSDKSRVLTATVYVTDMAAKKAMNEAWVAFFGEADLPSRATVGVANLGTPETLIEVVITATR
jgi:2-iminobutanoate/2-iminopropanoate deaminase